MLSLAFYVTPFVFAFLVIYGALSDLSTFKIPNWISYSLCLLFLLQSFVLWFAVPAGSPLAASAPSFPVNLGIGLVVLVTSTIFWARGHIGGGDVKYLTATSLFMGPDGVVVFMVLLSGLALVMATLLKLSRNWGFLVNAGRMPDFVKRIYAKLEVNQLPYGFPIGIAALAMIPQVFKV
jgi:prepilin peptidase CpaA